MLENNMVIDSVWDSGLDDYDLRDEDGEDND